MNFNHEHNEIISTSVGVSNPYVGFIMSILLLLTGNSLPEVTSHISNFEIPKIVMQTGQLIAWISAGGLFVLALIKFIIERINSARNKKTDAAN